jgi:uncharacterized protein (TIGR03435 family)
VITALVLVLGTPVLFAQGGAEFDVASIRRNTSETPTPTPGGPPNPASGQINMTWATARGLVIRAFTGLTVPIQVFGAPEWADNERYDVSVRFRPGATAEEQAQMWRNLLRDRMKLSAHVEMRQRPTYNLVVARPDGRLGPQLKVSSLDCPPLDPSQPPPRPAPEVLAAARPSAARSPESELLLMSQCRATFTVGNTTYAGAIPIQAVMMQIQRGVGGDRAVVDKTGLQGLYSMKLTFHSSPTPPGPDDPPSIFTAVQEQLGLKLEPGSAESRVLVIDHIERPSEN